MFQTLDRPSGGDGRLWSGKGIAVVRRTCLFMRLVAMMNSCSALLR